MKNAWRFLTVVTDAVGLLAAMLYVWRVCPPGSGGMAYDPRFALTVSVAFWVTGLVVLGWADPPRLAISLAGLNILAGLAILMAPAADAGVAAARTLEFAAMALLPVPFVSFFAQFPPAPLPVREARGGTPQVALLARKWGMGTAAGMSLILLAGRCLLRSYGLDPHILSRSLLGYLGVSLAAGVYLAWRAYQTAASPRQRDQLKVVALGAGGVLPFTLLSVLPQAVLGQPWLPPGATALVTVLLPFSLGYAMLCHDLLTQTC